MNENRKKILSTLESLYGKCKQNKYFLLENRKEDEVRSEIQTNLISSGIIVENDNILDLYLIITQIHSSVYIQI